MTWRVLITGLGRLLPLPAAINAADPRVEINLDANGQLPFQASPLLTGNQMDVPGLINNPFVIPIVSTCGRYFIA